MVSFRIPETLSKQFEQYIEDNALNRNLMVTLLLAQYLTERGVVAEPKEVQA